MMLTLLIPLKERHELTKRLLKYLNNISFPFNIILADGSKAKFNPGKYQNLKLEYEYYGEDKTIDKYIKKMSRASNKISTPLTMIVDADDLISLDGIKEGIRFLKEHNDYTSYRGAFIKWISRDSLYKEPSIVNKDVFGRLHIVSTMRNSCWNDIVRTNIIKSMFNICEISNTKDLQCMITLNVMWAAIFGNTFKCQDKAFYYHMPGPSVVQNGVYSKFNQWYGTKTFEDSVAIIVSAITCAIDKQINMSKDDIRNIVSGKLIKSFLLKNGITNNDKINNSILNIRTLSASYDNKFTSLIHIPSDKIDFDTTNMRLQLNINKDIEFIKRNL